MMPTLASPVSLGPDAGTLAEPDFRNPTALVSKGRLMPMYIVGLMSCVSLLGAYDRYLVGILAEDIKHDLNASDGQMGLLTGLGFALVYSLLAVPVARISDRGYRVPVLSISILLWSAMTALCALVANFPMLLLARFGVGVGEAGCIPTTQAIVSDHIPARWRTSAISIVTVASGVGLTVAGVAGGWIADHWGWRFAFLAGAIPGPPLAILLWLTVRKTATRPRHADSSNPGRMTAAVATLLKVRSLRFIYLGYALCTMACYGAIAWIPAYLSRTYSLSAGEVGASYGSIMGISTILALLVGGLLSEFLGRRDRRWPIWLMAMAFALAFPLTLAFLFAPDLRWALLLAVPMTFLSMASSSTAYAEVQNLSGPQLRATGSALLLLFYNLLGVGLGPSLVGWISDALAGSIGAASLRYALAAVSVTYLLGSLIMAGAARSIQHDAAGSEGRRAAGES